MTLPAGSRLRRAAWFIGLWLAGVSAVAMLAWLLRTLVGAQ